MFWTKKEPRPEAKALPQTIKPSRYRTDRAAVIDSALSASFPAQPLSPRAGTMDAGFNTFSGLSNFGQSISDTHINYFGNKGFIGYQACATLAQHWLIDLACTVPCEDALRKGWEITKNDGEEIGPELQATIRLLDNKNGIHNKALSFAKMGRVYGVRVAVFLVDNDDKEYYTSPFNLDGVTPGSFKGVLMNDPYYVIPDVTQQGQNPSSLQFYEPEYWIIGGQRYHKSHCVVFRHSELPQILKPSYLYGGISLTQQIYEAVYNAEISANEIPMLLQNMRMDVYKVDLARALSNYEAFEERLELMAQTRNNHGVRTIDLEDDYTQLQTTVTGLDELVLGRYKIAASIAQMPVAKLLKTDLTGGLVKGGGEEAIYHETLESLHCKIKPFLEKYYRIMLKSELNMSDEIEINFNKLDAMTEKELAEVNEIKSRTDSNLVNAGAIDGNSVISRLVADKQSGYNGLDLALPEIIDDEEML